LSSVNFICSGNPLFVTESPTLVGTPKLKKEMISLYDILQRK